MLEILNSIKEEKNDNFVINHFYGLAYENLGEFAKALEY